ncbi:MAG TPA: sulfatase-like hydrolase/transferase [Thermodesulfobacteriota bacterium]|nr:sulfatase-like hydrolase/transferase [Thermodesulfobacteriota bacterium]
MKVFNSLIKNRFGILYLFFAVFLVLSFITRTIFLIESLPELSLTLFLLLKIYSVGLFFDVVAMTYWAIPFILYLVFVPDKIYQSKAHRLLLYLVSFVNIFLLLFSGVAEYYFFDEFSTRFNFIAVDYLIYSHEVVNNIIESYPIFIIMSAIAVVSILLFLFLRRLLECSIHVKSTLKNRAKTSVVFLLFPLLFYLFVDISFSEISSNNYANELSSNGIYNLFAAFRNNQIRYETFYATRDNREVFRHLRALLKEKNSSFVTDDVFDITRTIKNKGKEKRLNVVVVMVESLSAHFLGAFGSSQNLTPNLDLLAKESILFTNLHATGTRTDRGLEAVTLSVPPIPGRSIIKRPHNENMFTWGTIMKSRGYDLKFIYGGYGYFDNMNYFFSHNGFAVVDRANLTNQEINFENAWGVCDEDLFAKARAEFTQSYQAHKPFLAVIMTTSNHRPYTYPEGRITIPSGSGRKGAVKYTDYAIGKFIRDVQEEPWFKDTVFIIVADHCAYAAGRISLPVKKYVIPFLVYAPDHFPPQKIDKLASQIDIAPTVLGLLNFNYTTNFFGKDIFKMQPDQERAFIGTYQKLGYMKSNLLAVLDVKKRKALYQFDRTTGEMRERAPDENLINEAISYYQGANYLFENHRDKE